MGLYTAGTLFQMAAACLAAPLNGIGKQHSPLGLVKQSSSVVNIKKQLIACYKGAKLFAAEPVSQPRS
jgi:hypothetical protein